jgi:predicted nucleic acid-binding protein
MPKKSEKVPWIYIDTNFILDCTEGRNTDSVVLMEKIREQKWKCISSTFSIMEISDIVKDSLFVSKKLQRHWTINKILRERYRKDLSNDDFEDVEKYIFNKVFKTYSFITFLTPSQEGWITALELSAHSNIPAPDIMHLATAWNARCNVVVTSDGHFIRDSKKLIKKYPDLEKIKVCRPKEVIEVLKKMGFKC